MSKKTRGLSLDQKRDIMLAILNDNKRPFLLKELEKTGSKRGVRAQSVKEVVVSLVDDNLAVSDKVGIQTLFWSFPSETSAQLIKIHDSLGVDISSLADKVDSLENKIEEESSTRVAENRASLLEELKQLRKEKEEKDEELAKYKENDVELFARTRQECETLARDANLWTDNIFEIKSYCKKKFGIEGKDLDKQFQLPEDFDYVQ